MIIAVLGYRRKTTTLEEPLLATEKKSLWWRAGPFLVAVAAAPSAAELLENVRYERFHGRPCVLPVKQRGGPSRRCVCGLRPAAARDAKSGRRRRRRRGNSAPRAAAALGVDGTTFALKAAAAGLGKAASTAPAARCWAWRRRPLP